jgi:hypothetical protein
MKYLLKILTVFILFVSIFSITGCSSKENNITGSLEDIMSEVYKDVDEDQLPMYLESIEVNEDNVEGFLGTKDIAFKEALASESMVGSIAHSVVLVRMENQKDVNDAVELIKENIDPNKWICVGVDNVIVESKGDLIIVILDDNNGDTILKSFQNLK